MPPPRGNKGPSWVARAFGLSSTSAYLGRIIRQHGSRYVLGSQFPTKDIPLLGAYLADPTNIDGAESGAASARASSPPALSSVAAA